jgi:hypothetical protein
MVIDLTPSAIARKFTPEGTAPEVVAVVEAMAERALREVGPQPNEARAMIFAQRLMVQAAEAVRAQHLVRVNRLFNAISEWKTEDDNTEGDPTDGAK